MAADTPLPVRVTNCGLPTALSATEMDAVRVPVALGVNVTLMVQVVFAPRVLGEIGQLLVCAKSLAFVPTTVMPVMVNGAVPLFDKITV